MFAFFEEKFREIDVKLSVIIKNNASETQYELLNEQIERVYNLNLQHFRFNSHRSRVLAELDKKLRTAIENADKIQTNPELGNFAFLAYFKNTCYDEKPLSNKLVNEFASTLNEQSNVTHRLISMHQLGTLNVKNEFRLLNKFLYMDFYFNYEAPELKAQCEFYQLTAYKYVLYDAKSHELCLVTRKFVILKKITIAPIYSFIYVDIHNAQLVVTLNNHGCWPAKTFIYLFDENLNLLSRKLGTQYVYSNVSCEKKKLVYTNLEPAVFNFVILDRDLTHLKDYYFNENKLDGKNVIHLNENTVYLLISTNHGAIQICDRLSGDLLSTVNVAEFVPDFVSFSIKFDCEGNIFIFTRSSLVDIGDWRVVCFSADGRFLFNKPIPLLRQFSFFDFNDDNVYFYNF
jgi:hypothetical protein